MHSNYHPNGNANGDTLAKRNTRMPFLSKKNWITTAFWNYFWLMHAIIIILCDILIFVRFHSHLNLRLFNSPTAFIFVKCFNFKPTMEKCSEWKWQITWMLSSCSKILLVSLGYHRKLKLGFSFLSHEYFSYNRWKWNENINIKHSYVKLSIVLHNS